MRLLDHLCLRLLKCLCVFAVFFGTAHAQSFSLQPPNTQLLEGTEVLFGIWGTKAQCSAHTNQTFSNPSEHPISIDDQWLSQGGIYCFLSWHKQETLGNTINTYAFARCGEDAVRDYRIVLALKSNTLQIRWSPQYDTKPMQMCK
ncbi:MAG: hypothetical protein AAF434_02385 [Pseudomonadota bacterium]